MQSKFGVYLGRFSPMHLGHVAVINTMLNDFEYNECLLLIGSANTPQSLRHFFTYGERKQFIESVFPYISIVPMPDFPNNNPDWFSALEDILLLKSIRMDDVVFYTGCEEDVVILSDYARKRGAEFRFCNRFDGTTPKISATEVRDSLIHGRSLVDLLDPITIPHVERVFKQRWNEFQNK